MFESSHANSHKQLTKKKIAFNVQYTHSMEKDTVYIHTCAFFFFLLAHTLNINKWAPLRIHNEMDILSNNNVHELFMYKMTLSIKLIRSMVMSWWTSRMTEWWACPEMLDKKRIGLRYEFDSEDNGYWRMKI